MQTPETRLVRSRHPNAVSASALGLFSMVLTGSFAVFHTVPTTSARGAEDYVLSLMVTPLTEPDGDVHVELGLQAPDGGYRERLTNNPTITYYEAALSPDLNHLAFVGIHDGLAEDEDPGLYIAAVQKRPDGRPMRAGEPQLLLSLPKDFLSQTSLCWLGDSRTIVYAVRYYRDRVTIRQDLCVVDASSGQSRQFLRVPLARTSNPVYSSSAGRVAFTALVTEGNVKRRDVFTSDMNGNDVRRVTHPGNCPEPINVYPYWSPDGQAILVYGRELRYRIPSDGSGQAVSLGPKPHTSRAHDLKWGEWRPEFQ